ncbi:hypothetical protein HY413_00610 [Candidatus Kaiserbacteria bacterium]|nr:hypothetical protein [Candidatus Kaiserbacteria bacterium]
MIVAEWADVFQRTWQDLWFIFWNFIPNLVFAVVIFIIGWVLGSIVGRVLSQVIRAIRVDDALRGAGVEELMSRAGFGLNSGRFVGELAKWFIVVVFLMASLQVLGLTQVNIVLQSVVLVYLPQIIAAVLILILAAVVAELAKNVVVASARAAGTHSVYFMGALTKWVIWILAFLAALSQIGIAAEFAQMLFMGVVIGLSIAFGLAFGLGGKDAAADYIGKLRKEMAGHH